MYKNPSVLIGQELHAMVTKAIGYMKRKKYLKGTFFSLPSKKLYWK